MRSVNRRNAIKTMVATGAVLCGGSTGFAAEGKGWYVRFNKKKTEATSCKLWIGLGGGKKHQEWTTWKSSDDPELKVPDEFKDVAEIWIKGKADPKDRNVYLCLHYNDHAVKHMDFDDEEEHEKSQGDTDDCVE